MINIRDGSNRSRLFCVLSLLRYFCANVNWRVSNSSGFYDDVMMILLKIYVILQFEYNILKLHHT